MTDYPQKGENKVAKRCLDDTDYFKRKACTEDCIYYEKCIYRTNKEVAKKKQAELKEKEDILKNTNRHDIGELQIYQSYSLERKIELTKQRIEAWYEWWDGKVYISFSGGKDSTVLLDLVRNVCGFKDVPAVFIDTGLEYPEIREFVKKFDNVIWLKPKKNFKQVIKEYGYPFISKEVSECVQGAKRYLTSLLQEVNLDKQASKQASYKYNYDKLCGIGKYSRDNGTTESKQTRGQESKACKTTRNVDRHQPDKGEYP